eukprot:3680772-Pyramimonas_sp.AAC.1
MMLCTAAAAAEHVKGDVSQHGHHESGCAAARTPPLSTTSRSCCPCPSPHRPTPVASHTPRVPRG